jgi:hypothetical protein
MRLSSSAFTATPASISNAVAMEELNLARLRAAAARRFLREIFLGACGKALGLGIGEYKERFLTIGGHTMGRKARGGEFI